MRLAQRHQLVGKAQLQIAEDLLEPARDQDRVRLEVLLTGRGVDGADRSRRCERRRLGGEPDHLLVQDHQPGVPARLACELLGQAGEPRVEQAVQTLLCEVEDVDERDRQRLERQRDRVRVEAAGGVEALGLAGGRVHVQGAVGDRAELATQLGVQLLEHVERGPVHLGDHPERDRRLQGRLPATAAVEQLADATVNSQLPGVALQLADAHRIRPGRRVDHRHGQRSGQSGVLEQRLRTQRQRNPQRGSKRRAVDQRDPLLGAQLVRSDVARGERVRGCDDVPVEQHGSRSGERLEQVSERDRLARGAADGGGNDRQPAVVEAVGDEPAQAGAHAGAPAQKARQPQQHRPADDRGRQRRPDPGGPAEQDRALKRGLVVGLRRRD